VDVSIVNAIRRIILSEIPSAAFAFDPNAKENDIKITKNTGSLHNEFISHRISLIPLHFDDTEVKNFNPDKYNFVLHEKNTSDTIFSVTTEHFKIFDETGKEYPKNIVNAILPPNPITKDYILITKLKPNLFNKDQGDEIHIQAKASLNIGKTHARWTPVSLCTYYNNIDEDRMKIALEAYIKQHKDTGLTNTELEIRFNTLEKYRCFKMNKYLEPNSLRFELESECGLTCQYIFKNALSILIDKFKRFISNLDENTDIIVTKSQGMTIYTIMNEDHTFGNTIQSLLYNDYIRNSDDKELSYIGYYKPHPLEDNIILKVKCEKDTNKFLKEGSYRIIDILTNIQNEWSAFMKMKK
jgi:DNA-directed RNA polymerase subunit L